MKSPSSVQASNRERNFVLTAATLEVEFPALEKVCIGIQVRLRASQIRALLLKSGQKIEGRLIGVEMK